MGQGASIALGLVFDALKPRPKADPWRLGHFYACRALSLPVADRSQRRATPLTRNFKYKCW